VDADAISSSNLPESYMTELITFDVDDDGVDDIIATDRGSGNTRIWAFDNDTQPLWNYSITGDGTQNIANMMVSDLNIDGNYEIVFFGEEEQILTILNMSGSPLFKHSIPEPTGSVANENSGMDIADVNLDGINDIALALREGFAVMAQEVNSMARFNDSTAYNMT